MLEGFVRECKEKELDLVLDLRQNEGGYLAHSSALLAMLGERAKTYPGGALLLRANTLNQLIYQQRSPTLGGVPARTGDDAFEPRRIAEAIGAARAAHGRTSPRPSSSSRSTPANRWAATEAGWWRSSRRPA